MTHDFFVFLTQIAAKTAVVLLTLVVAFRLLGKRQVGQMNVYDLVLILMVANAVQNAMTVGAGDLLVGIVSAGTLLVIGRILTVLFVRRPSLEQHLIGTPTVVINDGRLLRDNMRREHITEDQVMAGLRVQGIDSPHKVKLAILEVDGALSVVPRDKPTAGGGGERHKT